MPSTIEEKWSGEAFDGESFQVGHFIFGAADVDEAKTDLLADVAGTRNGLPLRPLKTSIREVSSDVFEGVVTYAPLNRQQVANANSGRRSFSTTGGTASITQSRSTIASYAPSALDAPDFGGALNVADGRPGAVSVEVPALSLQITRIKPAADVTLTYQRTLAQLTGRVNSTTFEGFQAGELKFLGASGNELEEGDFELTWDFAASFNETGLTVGDITGIDKKGWEYLWVYHAEEIDSTTNTRVIKPRAVYVEQLFETADFTSLGIPA